MFFVEHADNNLVHLDSSHSSSSESQYEENNEIEETKVETEENLNRQKMIERRNGRRGSRFGI